jgi:hypothetical protein
MVSKDTCVNEKNMTFCIGYFPVQKTKETSRCPCRAFVRHFRVSFFIGQIMSNLVIHVKSCDSCQIILFMSNHVFPIKSCHSYQIMSFMSNHVIHVKSCHSCQIVSFMSNKVGVVGSKSAFKAFGGQLCCRPKAKRSEFKFLTNK